MTLRTRPKDHFGIFFSGRYVPGVNVGKCWIANGDRVDVYVENDLAHVLDVTVLGDGKYRGRVASFHESPEDAIGDIAIGCEIEFADKHVSSCVTP